MTRRAGDVMQVQGGKTHAIADSGGPFSEYSLHRFGAYRCGLVVAREDEPVETAATCQRCNGAAARKRARRRGASC